MRTWAVDIRVNLQEDDNACMSDDEIDEFPDLKGNKPDVDLAEVLLTEYQETGNEIRSQARMLHNAYYLSAIVFTFFIGSAANLYYQGYILGTIFVSLAGAGAFLVLAIAADAYHQRRKAASHLRTQLSAELHHLTDSDVPRLQRDIIGREHIPEEREHRLSEKGRLESLNPGLYRFLLVISAGFFIAALYLGLSI